MTPKHWIDPRDDNPEEGQIRIVKLADGRLQASVWRQLYANPHCWYCDRHGNGIDGVVAVGAPLPKRKYKSGPSGPSGGHTVPQKMLRCPDALWAEFGLAVSRQSTNRTAELLRFMREYCAQHAKPIELPEPDDGDALLQQMRDRELERDYR